MSKTLTVPEIAYIIGVEEAIIRSALARRDENLVPYLHEPSDYHPSSETQEGEETHRLISQPLTPLLDLEGLPLLITRLAFNIPTTDIIENLACQVLHLIVLQEENVDLIRKNQELQHQNEHLERRNKDLQQQLEMLQARVLELTEADSQKGVFNFFRRGKPK
jgi:FtsZ-binding cell division protein ZapB